MASLAVLVAGLSGRTVRSACVENGWVRLDFVDGSFAAIDWNGAKIELADDAPPAAGDAFDPCAANTAETSDQALALATAWADGRRSWTNLGGANPDVYTPDVIAAMDAQEVVKWSALAVALAQIDLAELQRQVAIDGAPV